MALSGGATWRPTTSAALAVKFGSLLSHQDLRATRSILWLRRKRQTYCTFQNPHVGGLRIDRLLARPRLVLRPFKSMVGIAMPPRLTIRGCTPTSLAIDRVLRPAAANRTIRARFKSRCNVTGERQQASSALAILPRKVDFSCFGYHPDVESRLTL